MDTEKSNLITEQLLQAMDIIANKKIENLPFDKTILCVITEVTDEEEGIYEVSFSSNQAKATHFTAYAQKGMKYAEGDNVYVNIPQNDFSNQKTIIGKYISDQATPINYIFPMDRFIHVKDLEYTKSTDIWINNEVGLKANGDDLSIPILNEASPKVLANKYDCLGISADFKTLLGSYKPLEGEYGLRFTFIGLKDGWDINTEHLADYFVYKVDTFSNKEMYGMTYDYFTYSNQQKLINLQDFPYPIYAIKVEFYQNKDFKDIKGKPIPATIDAPSITFEQNESDEYEQKIGASRTINLDKDLFVKNLTLSFGYLLDGAEDKELRLYTTSILQYGAEMGARNQKTLKLRWLEKNEDNQFTVIDEYTDKPNDFWNNKSIYLYKYSYGQHETDEYGGLFWKKIAEWNPFEYLPNTFIRLVKQDDSEQYYYDSESFAIYSPHTLTDPVKMTETEQLNLEGISSLNNPFDPFNIKISIPNEDTYNAFVRYKVIIVEKNLTLNEGVYTTTIDASYGNISNEMVSSKEYYTYNKDENEIIYESNEITFENIDETISQAAMALIQGLTLECTDGSNGIYRIYGEDNKITAQTNHNKMTIKANFDVIHILNLQTGNTTLTWYYPSENTMLVEPTPDARIDYKYTMLGTETVNTLTDNDIAEGQYYVKKNNEYIKIEKITFNSQEQLGYYVNNQPYRFYKGTDNCYLREEERNLSITWNDSAEFPGYKESSPITLAIADYDTIDSIENYYNELSYTIDSFYSSLRTNNTIKCKINRYGRDYWAEKEFFFGHQGNNGTNYAFDISLEREYNSEAHTEVASTIVPFLSKNNNNFIKVKATLIYGQNEITDLSKIHWGWEVISKSDNSNNDITIYDSRFRAPTNSEYSLTGNCIYLKINNTLDLSKYYGILKAEIAKDVITVDGDTDSPLDSKSRNVTLTAYLPIGISANSDIETYIGGTSILYNDYGSDPVYYEGKHELIGINKTEVEWEFLNSDTGYNPSINNSLSSSSYYPRMVERQEEGVSSTHEWFIRPTSIYFNNINNTGRIAVKKNNEIIFVQPIFISQNAWGNQTINQWDGALKIDSEGNYILSSMIGAGIKNSNNTFSGVLLGQIGKDYKAKTGIYGYGEGVQTYGFREDGTAFIGASGAGRIEFDTKNNIGIIKGGQNTILKRANENDGYTMTINLTEGSIRGIQYTPHNKLGTLGLSKNCELYKDNNNITYYKKENQYYLLSNNTEYTGNPENLSIITEYYSYIFNAQDTTYPLQIGDKFKIKWDGTAELTDALVGNQTIETIVDNLQNADSDLSKSLNDLSNIVETNAQSETIYNTLYEYTPDSGDYAGETFILSNKQYTSTGVSSNFTFKKEGLVIANNGIFNGVVTAYAGEFGGWYLTPGILSYGHNMSYTNYETGQGVWTGDFFTNNNTTQIGTDPLTNNTVNSVNVNKAQAFIYLRNGGQGINITGFAGNTYTNATSNDISQGYLKNIIFSLGKYFAVDKDGQLFASSGTFSGKVTASSGKIGGWTLNAYNESNNTGGELTTTIGTGSSGYTITLDPTGNTTKTINSTSHSDLVFVAGSNFGISKDGAIHAAFGTIGGLTLKDGYLYRAIAANNSTITTTNSIVTGAFYLIPGSGETINSHSNIVFSIGQNFQVDNQGNMYASNGTFSGAVTATSLTIAPTGGTSQSISDYVNGVASSAATDAANNAVVGVLKKGEPVESGNYVFKVDTNGHLTATGATINGNASITGTLTASQIQGPAYTGTYSGSTYTRARGLSLNTSTVQLGFWKNSLFTTFIPTATESSNDSITITDSTRLGYRYCAFLRGCGPDSWTTSNAFLGIKKMNSTSYTINDENAQTADTYRKGWNSPKYIGGDSSYLSFIRFDGQAKFQSIRVGSNNTGYNVPEVPSDKTNSDANMEEYTDYFGGKTISSAQTISSHYYGININGTGFFKQIVIDGAKLGGTKSITNRKIYWTATKTPSTYYTHADWNPTYQRWNTVYVHTFSQNTTVYDEFDGNYFILNNGIFFADEDDLPEEKNLSYYASEYDARYSSTPQTYTYTTEPSLCISSAGVARLKSVYTRGNVKAAGQVISTNGVCQGSDIKLKTNIDNLSCEILSFYNQLIPKKFILKKDPLKQQQYGFIAQDIQKLLVKNNIENSGFVSNYEGILFLNYNNFHALHVAKNHEQDARIQSLESEVASLRAELEQLKREKGGN